MRPLGTIEINGHAIYPIGMRVQFVCAPDLIATITAVHIYGYDNVSYTVSWIHDGNLKEETTNQIMLEIVT